MTSADTTGPESYRHRLSVVVPTCGRPELLIRCLERLHPRIQNLGAEIVVTDDGADDASRQVIAASPSFVRWTRGPRRGPAANRNHGASLATGDFIVFVDDDVIPSPTLLASYQDAVEPTINVYEGRTVCRMGLHSPLDVAPANETGGYLWSCNMMVRAAFWRSFGGFDEDFPYAMMEDVAYRERVKDAGHRIKFVPQAEVDHPPRRMPSARARIRVHESHFIYYYKYFGKRPSLPAYLLEFASYSLRPILRAPISADSAVALGSRLIETYYVLTRWRSWDDRFRRYAQDPPLLHRSL
jgi:GT2 family glycosyltransferase